MRTSSSPFKTLLVLLALLDLSLSAQNKKIIDSLKQVLKITGQDTNRVKTLNHLAWRLRNSKPDTAFTISEQALALSTQLKFEPGIAKANSTLGLLNDNLGQFDKALGCYFKAEAIWKRIDAGTRFERLAAAYNGIGNVYYGKGDFQKALSYFFQAIKIDEEIGTPAIVSRLINIGNVYYAMEDMPKALSYFEKALPIARKFNNKDNEAIVTSNMGGIYLEMARPIRKKENATPEEVKKALGYYERSMQNSEAAMRIYDSLNRRNGMMMVNECIGNIYFDKCFWSLTPGDQKKNMEAQAFHFYSKALELSVELGDQYSESRCLANLGSFFGKQGDLRKAETYLLKAIALADTLDALDYIMQFEESISSIYEKMNRFDLALMHYKLYITGKDSIFNEENTKKTVKLEMNFEFEKKEAAAKMEQEKKEAVAAADSKKQRIIIYSICGILLLVIGFAVFAYRSLLQKKKANTEISRQKHIIEEKQKEILDSIHYARRIQTALITSERYISGQLKRLMKE